MTITDFAGPGLALTDVQVGMPASGEINSMSLEAAMGMEPGFAGCGWMEAARAAALGRRFDPAELARIAEDSGQPFGERFVAGVVLGLIGDPRIEPLDPTMLPVPGGTYEIGLSPDQVDGVAAEFAPLGVKRCWIEKETPRHRVRLSSFSIGKYPVTNAEYAAFLSDVPAAPVPTSWTLGAVPPAQANHPVHSIPPEAADGYVAWLSRKTARCFRLPTEAEWEVAAGASSRVYPWGDRFEADHANTLEAGILWTTPVGIFPKGRSAFGCLDMGGNVEEFVSDRYTPYPGSEAGPDDLFMRDSNYRVARGGSYTRYRDLTRCRRRHGWIDSPLYAMGFRIAETESYASEGGQS